VGVEVEIPTDLFNLSLAKETISRFGDIQVIDLYTSPKMTCQLMAKRLIDVVASAILLILLSPIFTVVNILIKATSKGPVFFRQERVGYNGRTFTCLKFRTMIENAEALKTDLIPLNEMDGPVFKIKNDPRVTKVGSLLRKTSFDELPQLINVLMGDMSLVGPRPPVPGEVSQYDLMTRRRLSMRPGITCIWQVSGRNVIPFEKWMELDRQYIDQWSLWLDFKILAKTIPAVLRGSGAT
jgi:exopolysaccharide biosynthesis polyprenyl glycosylphosphotransferase